MKGILEQIAFMIGCRMKKKLRCPECDKKLKFWKPDKAFPNGVYHCKHCPNFYKNPNVR